MNMKEYKLGRSLFNLECASVLAAHQIKQT